MADGTPPTTLVRVLKDWVQRDPDFVLYAWLGDNGEIAAQYTFAELERRARAVGAELLTHAEPGDRALLLYPPGLEFLVAYVACLLSGVIAVPAYPPVSPRDLRRIRGIAASAEPRAVLGPTSLIERSAELAEALPALGAAHWLATDTVELARALDFVDPRIEGSSVAFLQYTSGSTGDPKGVIVTHQNLIANGEMIRRAFHHTRQSVGVGWLPHFHDMGLIGNVLQPLQVGFRNVLMSPTSMLRDPLRWLRAIARFRGRTSGGPNFAYELCALRSARAKHEQSLDLSSWELAYVGAEPIRAGTLEQFARAFEPYGFRRSAFYPCYGLAEATLFVTGAKLGEGVKVARWTAPNSAEKSRAIVSCGQAAEGEAIAIVDPSTARRCPDGVEGEVWVAGANVCGGYFRRSEESAHVFAAALEGDSARKFLRTGDLGVLVDGELLITGRLKDLIIVRGQNFYPQEIEAVVEAAHPALRAAASAAFSFVQNEDDCVAVVAEAARGKLDGPADEVCQRIRVAVAEECNVRLDVVVLIAPQTIPKTSSGKIERHAARHAFLTGQLDVVGFISSVQGASDTSWASGLSIRPKATSAVAEPAIAT